MRMRGTHVSPATRDGVRVKSQSYGVVNDSRGVFDGVNGHARGMLRLPDPGLTKRIVSEPWTRNKDWQQHVWGEVIKVREGKGGARAT